MTYTIYFFKYDKSLFVRRYPNPPGKGPGYVTSSPSFRSDGPYFEAVMVKIDAYDNKKGEGTPKSSYIFGPMSVDVSSEDTYSISMRCKIYYITNGVVTESMTAGSKFNMTSSKKGKKVMYSIYDDEAKFISENTKPAYEQFKAIWDYEYNLFFPPGEKMEEDYSSYSYLSPSLEDTLLIINRNYHPGINIIFLFERNMTLLDPVKDLEALVIKDYSSPVLNLFDEFNWENKSFLAGRKFLGSHLSKVHIYLRNSIDKEDTGVLAFTLDLKSQPLTPDALQVDFNKTDGVLELDKRLKAAADAARELVFKGKYRYYDFNDKRREWIYGEKIPKHDFDEISLDLIEFFSKEILVGRSFLFEDPSGNQSFLTYKNNLLTERSGKYQNDLKINYSGRGYWIEDPFLKKRGADHYTKSYSIFKAPSGLVLCESESLDGFNIRNIKILGNLTPLDEQNMKAIDTSGKEVFVHSEDAIWPNFTQLIIDVESSNTGLYTGLIEYIFNGEFDKITNAQAKYIDEVHNIYMWMQSEYFREAIPSHYKPYSFDYILTTTRKDGYGSTYATNTNKTRVDVFLHPRDYGKFQTYFDVDHFSEGIAYSYQKGIRESLRYLLSDVNSIDHPKLEHWRNNLYRYVHRLPPIPCVSELDK